MRFKSSCRLAVTACLGIALLAGVAYGDDQVADTQAEQVQAEGTSIVTGRFSFPDPLPSFIDPDVANYTTVIGKLLQLPDNKREPVPDNWPEMTSEQRRAWYAEWKASPEGVAFFEEKARVRANLRQYDVVGNKDGSFEIQGVEPGNYMIRAAIPYPGEDGIEGIMSKRSSASGNSQRISVTASSEAVDAGVINMSLFNHIAIGDMAPDFTVPDLQGEMFSLSDYRGKHVMIEFWATWCVPCIAQEPFLETAYNEHSGDGFEIIALSLDNETGKPIAHVEKNGIRYKQGFLGAWGDDQLTALYNVRGIPANFLVDPEGKIVAMNLWREQIPEAVTKALTEDAQALVP